MNEEICEKFPNNSKKTNHANKDFQEIREPSKRTQRENVEKKLGGAVSVHTATGSNVKCLRVAVRIKKISLKCQNFRITISSNYSKN